MNMNMPPLLENDVSPHEAFQRIQTQVYTKKNKIRQLESFLIKTDKSKERKKKEDVSNEEIVVIGPNEPPPMILSIETYTQTYRKEYTEIPI